jgi:FHS family L-fucose permease-like MFS transporter
MAILGGAIMPVVMGRVMDRASTAVGYVVPAVCLALVAAYALFDLRTKRHGGPIVAEGAR